MRGVAILLVMIYHQTLLDVDVAATPIDDAFARIAGVGWCGVDLFFVLSGFLITGILWDARGNEGYFRNFYARRTLRIFPLYYAVVFLSLVVLPNLPETWVPAEKAASFGRIEGDEIWYWLYLSNFSTAAAAAWRHGILDIAWSLSIEEQFYLVWPAVVWALDRRALQRLCVGVFFLALAVRIGTVVAGADPIVTYVITPARLDPLAAGAFVALAVRGPGGLEALVHGARRVAALSAGVLGALAVWRGGLPGLDPMIQILGYSALALLFASGLVLVSSASPGSSSRRLLESGTLRMFGKYSYALYLFHLPVRAVIRDTAYGRADFATLWGSQIPGQLLFYGVSTAGALVLAWLSWHLFESRILAFKRHFGG